MFPVFVDNNFENKIFEATAEEYHLIKDATHSGSLVHMLKSPYAYKFFLEHKKEATKPMKFGSLVHAVILEGWDYFKKNYVVQPVFEGYTLKGVKTTSMNCKDVKDQYDYWFSNLSPGAKVCTQEDVDKMSFMLDSVLTHKFAKDILTDGFPEHKIQWRDPITGIKSVCSNDFVSYRNDIWADVKTTPSSDWYDFRRTVENLNLPFQAAKYNLGLKEVHGKEIGDKVWISIESQAPYEVRVHYVDPYYLEVGEKQVRTAMKDLSYCLKNNVWDQSQLIIESGEPSPWYRNKNDLILEQ